MNDKKPAPRKFDVGDESESCRNVLIMFFLFALPLGLAIIMLLWNRGFILRSMDSIQLEMLIFRWVTLYKIIAVLSAFLAGIFYIYTIVIKGYWGYLFGIPLQLGVFLFTWFLVTTFQQNIEVFASIKIKETTYHLVQVRQPGSGSLYVFDCVDDDCKFSHIDSEGSTFYYFKQMVYNSSNRTLYIDVRAHGDVRYIFPLDEN